MLAGRLHENLQGVARLTGELASSPLVMTQNNLFISPQFADLQAVLIRVLAEFPEARALQNAWIAGSSSPFGGGGRGAVGAGNAVIVTMADGSKLEGTLVRKDDFIVILMLPDGTRKAIARSNGVPKVDVKDPKAAHKRMVLELDDPQNRRMHDVTAYLWTIK